LAKKKLQVFISSTYIDLIDERQSAVQAVLDSGHIPAGMELFKAGNETQLDTIYKWIDNSDVYMLILGGRYGSVDEKSQKSYTRLEYEYALKKGIPIFSVVLTEKFLREKNSLLGNDKTYEQKNKDKYDEFKLIVLSKIVRMVDDAKDIMLTIHSTLVNFLEEYENLVGWIRANDSEANTSLLTQINSLSIENKELYEKNSELKKNIDLMQSEFESDLAFEGEVINIQGTYSEQLSTGTKKLYQDRNIEKEITWDKMFLLWAPRLTATINSARAKSELEYALKDYMGRYFKINENLFQTIKIQFTALGLIKYYEAQTTKAGSSEFIKLTSKGSQHLIRNTAIKKFN
jgi:hypothetical protein